MTAFLELLNTYAIFFYIAGVIGVLFGIKMLFDARRAGRTTLFTLEQEQASDRAFRAVVVMAGATLFIAGVAAINAFVAPVIPAEPTDVINPTAIPFTPPVILPSATPQPTLTLPPPTPAPATGVPATAAPAGPTAPPAQPSAPPQPTAPVEPTAPPTEPPSASIYLAPPLNTPPNGDSIGASRVRFSWGMDSEGNAAVPASLPQDQFFRLVITFTDKNTNAQTVLPLCSHENSVDQRSGVTVNDYRSEALNSSFTWNVTIVQSPSQEACMAGDFTPLSPTSATYTFILP